MVTVRRTVSLYFVIRMNRKLQKSEYVPFLEQTDATHRRAVIRLRFLNVPIFEKIFFEPFILY